MRILSALDEVAPTRDASPAQLALAWGIARPGITASIASSTSLAQLIDLLAGARLELTHSELDRLNEASVTT